MPRFDANPAHVLLSFRDGTAVDWDTLCGLYDMNPRGAIGDTRYMVLIKLVSELIAAGLLIPEHEKWYETGSIQLSDEWPHLQTALRISLQKLAVLHDLQNAMYVEPLFGPPADQTGLDVLVLMPFTASLEPVFEDHIQSVAHRLQLVAGRADDFATSSAIMKDVWSAICAARFIVADCTQLNPNVFYEVGIAHTLGRDVVLIAQKGTVIPFDIGHIRYLEYELTPRGMKEFEERLYRTIQSQLSDDG